MFVIVLDAHPQDWFLSQKYSQNALSLSAFLSQFAPFVDAFIACTDSEPLSVLAALPGKSVQLYPDASPTTSSQGPLGRAVDTILTRLDRELDLLANHPSQDPSALVSAIAKALCLIHRQPVTQDPSRILVLSVSPDVSSAHVPIMNCIFSAQKLGVTIDVCRLFGGESLLLQQAAHLTNGSYVQLDRRDALLQYLIMAFLPPPHLRQTLLVPTQDKIDLRASCFCHRNVIDIGYVCSVCLSIFCQPIPVCSTCRAKFPIKTLQRLNSSKITNGS